MNTISKIFLTIGAGASMLALGGCIGDLDQMPQDPSTLTAGSFGEDPEGYMDAVMADVYLQFATYGADGNSTVQGFDGGMSTFQRGIFLLEEIPTDEANWLPAGDAAYGTLQYGIVPANNAAVYGVYSRLMINIALCNDFIQTVDNGYFQLPDNMKSKAEEYVRQCKILRSGCYFYMLSLFGNVPYADENTAIGSVPAQMSRSEVYNLVVATLEEVAGEASTQTSYGYVGKDAADALLVKFYLNAQVFSGTPAWDKCYAKANELIARHQGAGFNGSGLCEHYNQLFAYNNDQYAVGGSNAVSEILWTIPQNDVNLKSWANSTFLMMGFLGYPSTGSESWNCQKDWYNVTDGWKCMTARKQFVEKFEWNEASMATSPDQRVKGWCTSAQGFTYDNVILDQDHFGSNGYLPVKFSNYSIDANGNIDIAASPSPTNQTGGDYPVIRLAEIYLSAAEAALQGGGDKGKALDYVNIIRQRAGLNAWTAADLNLNSLADERCRELYQENCRRTDLIREGKWISGYNWDWKNQDPNGSSFPSTYNLYPLPSRVVSLAGYTQNPGY